MVLSIQHPPQSENGKFVNPSNLLLSLLAQSDRQNLLAQSTLIFLPSKLTLHKPHEPIETVYFPIEGVISLINTSPEGLNAESVKVSNEGMVGIAAFLGGHFLPSSAIVQTDCYTISIAADILKQEFARNKRLQRILLLYIQALFTQVSQNVFCSCHHTLEQRLARCLLSFSDRLSKRELLLTQETIANILGVRRSSLSLIASQFRQQELIDYSRGKIIIQNSVALRKIACECERLIAAEYSRLLDLRSNL